MNYECLWKCLKFRTYEFLEKMERKQDGDKTREMKKLEGLQYEQALQIYSPYNET